MVRYLFWMKFKVAMDVAIDSFSTVWLISMQLSNPISLLYAIIANGFPMAELLSARCLHRFCGILGTTFEGNHLACAAALAVLDVIERNSGRKCCGSGTSFDEVEVPAN